MQMSIKYQFLQKESYVNKSSFKYFIGSDNNDDIMPLCIKLPQMLGYAKYFGSIKTIAFTICEKRLLKKYIKIWEKISNLMKKEFDSDNVQGNSGKYKKSYGDKVNTNFQGKQLPKEKHIIQMFVVDNAIISYWSKYKVLS